ncbi:MAG TPA: RusA family crossover junction endodeoxyribonuclease [Actinomycetes bacterium]|nr:RusA family crossover junction endodeoxyribonuclease [Actinomycetes bacterium]
MTLRVFIPGNPGDGAINGAYLSTRRMSKKKGKMVPVRVKTDRGQSFSARAKAAILHAMAEDPVAAAAAGDAGTLAVTMVVSWPRQRHLSGAHDLAMGDVDAPVKATLDALEKSGLVDDDARVVSLSVRKMINRLSPGIELTIEPAPR